VILLLLLVAVRIGMLAVCYMRERLGWKVCFQWLTPASLVLGLLFTILNGLYAGSSFV
jgi:hypothetical protein